MRDAAAADRALLDRAREAYAESYVPYSEYRVGAAIATENGEVFVGCNVENANYSNSLHAEEVALGSAVAAGHRSFARVAVSSAARDGVTPCGSCRQTLIELCDPDTPVVCEGEGDPVVYRLGDLVPHAISGATLEATEE
jgi:cytidine deaminase